MTTLAPGTTDRILSRLYPEPDPWAFNLIGWCRHRLGEHLWSKQRDIARSIVKNRYTAVHSCHDSGKSFLASRAVAWWIDAHPPGSAFAITTAPTSHQVDAILWREISKAHRKGSLPGRVTLDSKWRLGEEHGQELVGYGRKPADYNPEAFQGIHQTYVLVVIDEANGVPRNLYDAIETVLTNVNARCLAIGNPDTPTSHFAKICKPGSGWKRIHIDGFGTPNFTGEKIPPGLSEDLLSVEWVEERRKSWGESSPLWYSKVRGVFPTLSDDALVQQDWWEAAARRDLPSEGFAGQFGIDVARYGDDYTLCYQNQGGHLRRKWQTAKTSTMETANRIALDLGSSSGVPAVIDGTGVGAGVVDRLREQDFYVYDFISGQQASSSQFANRRSEAYWHLREMFELGLIDVDPDDDELQSQLTSLRWTLNTKGQVVVESKDEYRKRLRTKSPDAADAAMMACWEQMTYDSDLLNHASIPTICHDLLEVVW